MRTDMPTVASGRVQLRRMASATATRMEDAGLSLWCSSWERHFTQSSTVTRPAAPLPAMPARSAACRPSSFIRAFIRGDMKPAPAACAGTGSPRTVGWTLDFFGAPADAGVWPLASSVTATGAGASSPARLASSSVTSRKPRVALPDLHEQLRHLPSARRGHAHRRLVRLDFENVLIAFDGSPDLERNRDNRGLGDGLPELRHDDWNSRHGKWGKG